MAQLHFLILFSYQSIVKGQDLMHLLWIVLYNMLQNHKLEDIRHYGQDNNALNFS